MCRADDLSGVVDGGSKPIRSSVAVTLVAMSPQKHARSLHTTARQSFRNYAYRPSFWWNHTELRATAVPEANY